TLPAIGIVASEHRRRRGFRVVAGMADDASRTFLRIELARVPRVRVRLDSGRMALRASPGDSLRTRHRKRIARAPNLVDAVTVHTFRGAPMTRGEQHAVNAV